MKLVLHLLAKDARHLRLEILASVALTFLLAAIYPETWSSSPGAGDVGFSRFAMVGGSYQRVSGVRPCCPGGGAGRGPSVLADPPI